MVSGVGVGMFLKSLFCLMAVSEPNSLSAVDWFHLQAQKGTNLDLILDRPPLNCVA